MDAKIKALQDERIARVVKVIHNEKPDRIPLVAWRSDYMYAYYGMQQNQFTNYDQATELYIRGNEEFDWDLCDLSDPFLLTYPLRGEAFKGSMYHLNDDRNAVQIDPSVIEIMYPEEYDQFIEDPIKYLADVALPRRYGVMSHDLSKEEKFKCLEANDAIGMASMKWRNDCYDKTGLVNSAHFFFSVPIDFIFDDVRNFTGIAKDIRRCPDKVNEASERLLQYTLADIEKAPMGEYTVSTAALHLAPFLKPKDFEKVYWPYFRDIVLKCYERGYTSKLLFEKSWKHVFNYLEELPDRSIMGFVEKEDGFENTKKYFGDRMIVVGGIQSDLLARGTVDEVKDQVKRTIDEACGDGGVMLCPDLPLIYPVDAKPENYKAAMETVRKYGNY